MTARSLRSAAVGLAVVATVTYVYGAWVGHFFDLDGTARYCAGRLAYPPADWSWLPLRHDCRLADGTSTALVPAYVNPLVVALLLAAAVCLVLAARVAARPYHRTW